MNPDFHTFSFLEHPKYYLDTLDQGVLSEALKDYSAGLQNIRDL